MARLKRKAYNLMTMIADDVIPDVQRLDAFHDLLPTLARALDVRDIFQHLSHVASRIVPHDEANLALLTEDGSRFRLYASTKQGDPELLCPGQHWALHDPDVPRVFDQGFGANCSFKSGLRVPVRVDGRPIGDGLDIAEPNRPAPPPAAYPPPADGATNGNYWYYCNNPQGYYPYVRMCNGQWQTAPANPDVR